MTSSGRAGSGPAADSRAVWRPEPPAGRPGPEPPGSRYGAPQARQPSGGSHLDPTPVDLRGARQGGAGGVGRRDLAVMRRVGTADLLRVDEDPQPHHGPVRLLARELLVAQRERPVEGEPRGAARGGRPSARAGRRRCWERRSRPTRRPRPRPARARSRWAPEVRPGAPGLPHPVRPSPAPAPRHVARSVRPRRDRRRSPRSTRAAPACGAVPAPRRRPTYGERGGGGAGRCVGDRVQEGAQQPLRVGQPRWLRTLQPLQRHGMGVRRHRGGEFAHPLRVRRAQRTGPPGAVIRCGETGQPQPARDQLQAENGGRTPERPRPIGLRGSTRPREDRQGRTHREQSSGHPDPLDTTGACRHHGQLVDGSGGDGGRGVAQPPECDPAGTGRITGHEHGTAVGQFGDLRRCCRGSPLHSDGIPQV